MPELTEITQAITEYIGDDPQKARDLAQQLRASVPAVTQVLIGAGAQVGRGEAKGQVAKLEQQLASVTVELDNAKAKVAELEAARPDVAKVIGEARAPLERKVRETEAELEKARATLRATVRDRYMEKVVNEAMGADVLDVYAPVIRARYADRIDVGEDGAVRVLQLNAADAYDAPDGKPESAIKQLVKDIARETPAEFRRARGESGAGVDPRPAGGGTVATTRQRLMDAKRTDPRFSGIV
jgi:hypothetical protein